MFKTFALALMGFVAVNSASALPLPPLEDVVVTEYSNLVFTSPVSFHQFGYLNITSGVPSAGQSLYFGFDATGYTTSPDITTNPTGAFDTLNLTLYGAQGSAMFSFKNGSPVLSGLTAPPSVLGTGTLISGTTNLTFDPMHLGYPYFRIQADVLSTLTAADGGESIVIRSMFNEAAPNILPTAYGFNVDGGTGTIASVAFGETPGKGADVTEPTSASVFVPVVAGMLMLSLMRRRRNHS